MKFYFTPTLLTPNKVEILFMGGQKESDGEALPQIIGALLIAIVIIFFILLFHFRKINLALLILVSMSLTVFGAAIGVLIMGQDVSMTGILGIVSLMGILVRNGIIMINEVAVILLLGLFGWKTALIYVITGLIIAITAGWIIGKLKLEHWVQDWVYQTKMGNTGDEENGLTFSDRIRFGFDSVKEIVGKVWIYVVVGIAVGAGAHELYPV